MGRLFFAAILGLIGLLYLGAAWTSLAGTDTHMMGDSGGAWLGVIIFLVVGVAAAAASVNLLREKRR
jgi:hypothetical protein